MSTLLRIVLASLLLLLAVSAQSPSRTPESSLTPTPSPSLSLSLTTSSVVVTSITRIGGQNVPITTTLPRVLNVTVTLSPTAPLATSTPSPTPIVLATKLDPAFGVLGTLLVLTGIPSAFWGHKNRWTSFFLIGFYTLSLVCLVLILKFGVLPAVNPPSKKLRGMFVLSSLVAGVTGGGITIFFWKGAKFFIGAWGGFALALYIQCLQNGGVIKQIGLRWILFIGCGVIGFVLCTISRIHYHILLVSTALVGATAFMLGVDCFTTAGLKEFYIWNLGFRSLFPKFTNNGIEFPVSQTMQIELGLMGAVALMGIAVQLRILTVLQRKLREIAEEQRKRDEEAETEAANRFADVLKDKDEWEKAHASARHGRNVSGNSMMPLMKDQDGSTSPTTDEQHSTFTLVSERRQRYQSGISDFLSTPEEELKRAGRSQQSPGALPALDLGLGIQEEVPHNFIAQGRSPSPKKNVTAVQLEELKRKEELLAEIHDIRKSIEALKSEVPSRNTSQTSNAALASVPGPSHPRPPREIDPRGRFNSLDLQTLNLTQSREVRDPISRPASAPLRDTDWDAYVRDRKLMQPPAGVTPPIATTVLSPAPRMPIPTAVADALTQRRLRESALELGEMATSSSSEDVPIANLARSMQKKNSQPAHIPVSPVALPPRRPSPVAAAAAQQPSGASRLRTLEELNQRHREKLRDLQAPLTQAEQAHAALETAKNRWERSKALEKEAVTKRQAEKAALFKEAEKRRKSEDELQRTKSMTMNESRPNAHQHSRSLSADKLATLGTATSSKRLSMLKVEDWRRYQQDSWAIRGRPSSGLETRSPGIPFPEGTRNRDVVYEQQRKADIFRDPLN